MITHTLRLRRRPAVRVLAFTFVVWLLPVDLTLAAGQGAGFTVQHAGTVLKDEVYLLNARIHYRLSKTALEALRNGVPLTLQMDIEVLRKRWLFWDDEVARLKQRYRIRYHAFSRQYLVTNLNTGVQQNFPSLRAALDTLGTVADFPMLDRRLLKVGEKYRARIQASLDIEALPLPLRLLAYVSPRWHLSSAWYAWPLQP